MPAPELPIGMLAPTSLIGQSVRVTRRTLLRHSGVLALASLAVLASAACSSSSGEMSAPTTAQGTTTSVPSSEPATAPAGHARFVGTWFAHTLRLKFDQSGHGTMTWRTYATCGSQPPPCDTFRGNGIEVGGHATLRIITYKPNAASGRVTSSTDQAHLPVGPFTFRLNPATDTADLSPSPRGKFPLCGPKAPSSLCG